MKKLLLALLILGIYAPLLLAKGQQDKGPEVPGTKEAVKLVHWSHWNETEPQAMVLKQGAEAFQRANPHVSVEAVWNGRQNPTLARNALDAEQQIDLIDAADGGLFRGFALDGLALKLDALLDQPMLDEPGKAFRQVIAPAVLNRYNLEGSIMLVPYIAFTVQFWYNKDIFTRAGVNKPKTWDEFLAVNEAILKAGYIPIAAESDVYHEPWLGYLVSRAKSCGFLLKTMGDKSGQMWRDPVYLKTGQAVRELWEKGHIPAEAKGNIWPAGQQTLALGEAAMELCGSWLPIELAPMVEGSFSWGAFNFPAVKGGEGAYTDLMMGTLAVIIAKSSRHPQEAFQLIQHYLSKEIQQKMSSEALNGPTRLGVPWPAALADAGEAMAQATDSYGWACDIGVEYAEFTNNLIKLHWKDLFLGEISPQEFVERMATESAKFWAAQQ